MDTAILALLAARMRAAVSQPSTGVGRRLAGLFRKPGFWTYFIRRAELKYELQLAVLRCKHVQELSQTLRPGVTVSERGAEWHLEIRVPSRVRCCCRASSNTGLANSRTLPHCSVPQR